MDVELTPDQRAFARQAIESGRIYREEEVVREALGLWEARERVRMEMMSAPNEAESTLTAGQGRIVTEESMRILAEEVSQRGRARLAAELAPLL